MEFIRISPVLLIAPRNAGAAPIRVVITGVSSGSTTNQVAPGDNLALDTRPAC